METLTPNEVSKILKLHPFTVTRLAREKKIPGFKVGGVWRFQKDRFEQWIVQQEPEKPKRSQHHGKPSQIHEYHMKKLIKTVKG